MRVVAYADHVDIWSPGGLDPRVDREAFLRGDVRPVWRNQALAWVFIKLQLAQSEGQGLPIIQASLKNEGFLPAIYALTDDSVSCVLPAHPRHARVRELLRVKEDVLNGRIARALNSLEALFADNPYDFRTVSLLAEISRSIHDTAPVLRFLTRHRDGLSRLPAAAHAAAALHAHAYKVLGPTAFHAKQFVDLALGVLANGDHGLFGMVLNA